MSLPKQIADHFRQVHFGGNWTSINLKNTVADITWEQANTKLNGFNTITALVYHMNYYVSAVLKVLNGQPLDAHDKYSFDHPPVTSAADWQQLVDKTLNDAETFAKHIEQLPETKLWEYLADEKYGNYYRNIHGIIEHTHYHLGQVVLLKKMLSS